MGEILEENAYEEIEPEIVTDVSLADSDMTRCRIGVKETGVENCERKVPGLVKN